MCVGIDPFQFEQFIELLKSENRGGQFPSEIGAPWGEIHVDK